MTDPRGYWCSMCDAFDVSGPHAHDAIPAAPALPDVAEGEMKEFLAVCEGDCAHPYCWSQKAGAGEQRGKTPRSGMRASNCTCHLLVCQCPQEAQPLPALTDEEYLAKAEKFLADAAKMNNAPVPYMIAAAFKNEDRAKRAESELSRLTAKEEQRAWIETPENAWLRGQSYGIHRMVQLYGHATDKTYEFAPYEAPTPPDSRSARRLRRRNGATVSDQPVEGMQPAK